jgi:alkylhydroperoxidase/carboxymuconolactone decarboxylase family protein YurZ
MIDFGFGDIYSRPHFNLKEQEIITLTSLISQGAGERQLVFHFKAALHVGLTKADIVEIIMHCAAYAGFPKASLCDGGFTTSNRRGNSTSGSKAGRTPYGIKD